MKGEWTFKHHLCLLLLLRFFFPSLTEPISPEQPNNKKKWYILETQTKLHLPTNDTSPTTTQSADYSRNLITIVGNASNPHNFLPPSPPDSHQEKKKSMPWNCSEKPAFPPTINCSNNPPWQQHNEIFYDHNTAVHQLFFFDFLLPPLEDDAPVGAAADLPFLLLGDFDFLLPPPKMRRKRVLSTHSTILTGRNKIRKGSLITQNNRRKPNRVCREGKIWKTSQRAEGRDGTGWRITYFHFQGLTTHVCTICGLFDRGDECSSASKRHRSSWGIGITRPNQHLHTAAIPYSE